METINTENAKEQILRNKHSRQELFRVDDAIGIFKNRLISDKIKIYESPSLAKGLICITEYLGQKYGGNRGDNIIKLSNNTERKKRIIQEYLSFLQDKKDKSQFSANQAEMYQKEVAEYTKIYKELDEGITSTMGSFSDVFMPERLNKYKAGRTDILEHEIIQSIATFMPDKKEMIVNNLNDERVKYFIDNHKDTIKQIELILEAIPLDAESQRRIFESLINCDINNKTRDEIIQISRDCQEKGNYFSLIIEITKTYILGLEKLSNTTYNSRTKSRSVFYKRLENIDKEHGPIQLDMLIKANPTLRPKAYNDFESYVKKQKLTILDFIKKAV